MDCHEFCALDNSVFTDIGKPDRYMAIQRAYERSRERIDELNKNTLEFVHSNQYLQKNKLMGQKYHNSLDEIVQNFGSYSCYIQMRGTDIEIFNLKPIESETPP